MQQPPKESPNDVPHLLKKHETLERQKGYMLERFLRSTKTQEIIEFFRRCTLTLIKVEGREESRDLRENNKKMQSNLDRKYMK